MHTYIHIRIHTYIHTYIHTLGYRSYIVLVIVALSQFPFLFLICPAQLTELGELFLRVVVTNIALFDGQRLHIGLSATQFLCLFVPRQLDRTVLTKLHLCRYNAYIHSYIHTKNR